MVWLVFRRHGVGLACSGTRRQTYSPSCYSAPIAHATIYAFRDVNSQDLLTRSSLIFVVFVTVASWRESPGSATPVVPAAPPGLSQKFVANNRANCHSWAYPKVDVLTCPWRDLGLLWRVPSTTSAFLRLAFLGRRAITAEDRHIDHQHRQPINMGNCSSRVDGSDVPSPPNNVRRTISIVDPRRRVAAT